MNCYVHNQQSAIGTCIGCGKFICAECCTEVNGKNYCKHCVGELVSNKDKEINKLENKTPVNQPMVFMNAGGASSSSSSSAASSSSSGGYRRSAPPYPVNSVGIHILLFVFTAGIGNIIYYFYVKNKQNQWNRMYR